MPTELTFWTLAEVASEALPELRPETEANVLQHRGWTGKGPYPHLMLEEHVLPFVVRSDTPRDEAALRRAFDLLERLAAHQDQDIVGATCHAFIDHVEPAVLERNAHLIGPALAQLSAEWRRLKTLPT